jgi:hypothetical protein
MSYTLTPATKVTLGKGKNKREYHLKFDLEAIAEAEDLLDKPLVTAFYGMDPTKPKISLVRGLFYALALKDDPELTPEQVKTLIATPTTVYAAWTAIVTAWKDARVEPDEDADEDTEDRPIKDQN